MPNSLQDEIQQSKPFGSLQEEVLLNIARTSAVLMHRMEQQFKAFGLTGTQYNVLRIVAGAGCSGIEQCDIAKRLVAETPDVPRLLKRTELAGLIHRLPEETDKRVRRVRLTPAGQKLLADIEPQLSAIGHTLFPHLNRAQLRTLNELLNLAR